MQASTRPVHERPLRTVTYLAPQARALHEAVTEALGRALGRPAELTTASSYAPFARAELEFGLVCGLAYVWLHDADPGCLEPLAAPVLAGERYGGRPVYYSDVVVQADRPWRSLAALEGRTWGYNERASQSGHGVVAAALAERGLGWEHFGGVVATESHAAALEMVADGRLDAAAVDSHVLSLERRRRPRIADALRVIERLGPSTIQPVVAARHVPAVERAAARKALAAMHRDPASDAILREHGVEHFTAVGDRDYDDIRRMERRARDAGLLPEPLVAMGLAAAAPASG